MSGAKRALREEERKKGEADPKSSRSSMTPRSQASDEQGEKKNVYPEPEVKKEVPSPTSPAEDDHPAKTEDTNAKEEKMETADKNETMESRELPTVTPSEIQVDYSPAPSNVTDLGTEVPIPAELPEHPGVREEPAMTEELTEELTEEQAEATPFPAASSG